MERGIALLEGEMLRLQNSIIHKDNIIENLEETKKELEVEYDNYLRKNRFLENEL